MTSPRNFKAGKRTPLERIQDIKYPILLSEAITPDEPARASPVLLVLTDGGRAALLNSVTNQALLEQREKWYEAKRNGVEDPNESEIIEASLAQQEALYEVLLLRKPYMGTIVTRSAVGQPAKIEFVTFTAAATLFPQFAIEIAKRKGEWEIIYLSRLEFSGPDDPKPPDTEWGGEGDGEDEPPSGTYPDTYDPNEPDYGLPPAGAPGSGGENGIPGAAGSNGGSFGDVEISFENCDSAIVQPDIPPGSVGAGFELFDLYPNIRQAMREGTTLENINYSEALDDLVSIQLSVKASSYISLQIVAGSSYKERPFDFDAGRATNGLEFVDTRKFKKVLDAETSQFGIDDPVTVLATAGIYDETINLHCQQGLTNGQNQVTLSGGLGSHPLIRSITGVVDPRDPASLHMCISGAVINRRKRFCAITLAQGVSATFDPTDFQNELNCWSDGAWVVGSGWYFNGSAYAQTDGSRAGIYLEDGTGDFADSITVELFGLSGPNAPYVQIVAVSENGSYQEQGLTRGDGARFRLTDMRNSFQATGTSIIRLRFRGAGALSPYAFTGWSVDLED